MFGFGKKKLPAGAREKIELAKKMRLEGRYNINQKGGGGDVRYPSQAIAITIIYVFTTLLAVLLTGGSGSPLSGMHPTGISSFDNFMTGSDIVSFTGNADEDKLITILGRGIGFLVLSGIIPLIAFALERLFFKNIVMPLVLCWGAIVVIMILYLCIPDNSVIPFFKNLPGNIKDLLRLL